MQHWRKSGPNQLLPYTILILCYIQIVNCKVSKTVQSVQSEDPRSIAEDTINNILNNKRLYNPGLRPRPNGLNNTATNVTVNVFLRNIGMIDDINMEYRIQVTVRQEWVDPRLKFNFTNFVTIVEDTTRIWTPDLFFMNEKQANFHNIMKPNVMIRITPINATVLLSIRISLILACPMDLKYYPLDRQTCMIRMGSYSWPTDDLIFSWKEDNPVQLPNPLNLPRFTLINNETLTCNHKTTTGEYSCLLASFTFQRELGYYMIQNFIPCGMIVMVSWISFWLGASTIDARVSLGITTMLTIVAQIYGINMQVPPVSYTKALDVFTGSCLLFIVMAIIEVSIVGYHIQLYKYRQSLPLPLTQDRIQGPNLLKRSSRIDCISRILFPLSFFMFNIVYWYTYQFSERRVGY